MKHIKHCCKILSFVFDNYQLIIILNKSVLVEMLFTQMKGNFGNSVKNVSLSNSFDVHCREVPIVNSLSPEPNVLDLDNAGEVSSSPNSPIMFAIVF